MPINSEFEEEKYSSGFSISGVNIEQTISQSFDPYSAIDINPNIFENTNQSLIDLNQDGRIPLGCFVFDDDNKLSDNFMVMVMLIFFYLSVVGDIVLLILYQMKLKKEIVVYTLFLTSIKIHLKIILKVVHIYYHLNKVILMTPA